MTCEDLGIALVPAFASNHRIPADEKVTESDGIHRQRQNVSTRIEQLRTTAWNTHRQRWNSGTYRI